MSHTNHFETAGLYRHFNGHVSGEEILQGNLQLHSDPRFKGLRYVINDFSQIDSHSIAPLHTKVYASTDNIIAKTKHALCIALVVTTPEHEALARHYRQNLQADAFQCGIFHSVDEARAWLEVNDA